MGCGATKQQGGGKSQAKQHAHGNGESTDNDSDHEYTMISFKDIILDELWDDLREERPQWKAVLERANKIRSATRNKIDPAVLKSALRGDFSADLAIHTQSGRIVIFVSSTFTDTEPERNSLMLDVFPFLRLLCRELDLEFGSVDMRWGVREDTTLTHGTTNMCLTQIRRCLSTSAGPAFVLIQGNKYGYRPLRTVIEKGEYDAIYGRLKETGKDVTPMDTWYRLDDNVVPASYILLPRKPGDGDVWWPAFEAMQVLFREGAEVYSEEEKKEPYWRSVTEDEIHLGLLNNKENTDQSYYFTRKFKGIGDYPDKGFFDVSSDGTVDAECQRRIGDVREKIFQALPEQNVYRFEQDVGVRRSSEDNKPVMFIGPAEENSYKNCLREFCDVFCEKISDGILKNYERKLHVEPDAIFEEACQHHTLAKRKGELVIGRDDILSSVSAYLKKYGSSDITPRPVLALQGVSGCGKTSVMARIATTVTGSVSNAIVIVRFLGTTAESSSSRGVMLSTGVQIQRALGLTVTDPLPAMYGDVCDWFVDVLSHASADAPIVLVLDSLDQMNDEDNGRRLKWLPGVTNDLPPYVTTVVSTLPNIGPSYPVLQGSIPTDQILQVPLLNVSDGPIIAQALLAREGRTLQPAQEEHVLASFKATPSPLLLTLAVQQALEWYSWNSIDETPIPSTIPSLIEEMFLDLERIYGKLFVERSLAYITAARQGLSTAELEDILSIDDEVLDDVYEWWTPPQRRIPPLLWLRVRTALGEYLVERGAGGRSVMQWYHRQFWEAAERRYLSDENIRKKVHVTIAQYFDGTHAHGKDYTTKDGTVIIAGDRGIDTQPLILATASDGTELLNRRKLNEMYYHYIQAGDVTSIERVTSDLSFIKAMFLAGQGPDMLSLARKAQAVSGSPKVTQFARFIGAQFATLQAEPHCLYQVASQESNSSDVFQAYNEHIIAKKSVPLALMTELDKSSYVNPCVMTLTGHKGSVRCVDISPNGEMFCSGSEDGTVRLWDAQSGLELFSVGPPLVTGKVYPKAPDPKHGEKPVKFSPDGQQVAVGTEDGDVIMLDIMGSEVWSRKTAHDNHVVSLAFSPDNRCVATGCRSGKVHVMNVANGSTIRELKFPKAATGCAFTPDSSLLLVGTAYGGVFQVNTTEWEVVNTVPLHGMVLTIKSSPDGSLTAAGSDQNSLHFIDWDQQTVDTRSGVHRAWVWQVDFSPDGKYIATASSDRSAKVWDVSTRSPIVTLRGHDHRVSHLKFSPDSQTLLTCSLDRTLRLWDLQLAIEGKDDAPKAAGGHYKFYTGTHDAQVFLYSQGWGTSVSILQGGSVTSSVASTGSVATIAVNHAKNTFVTRCYGECVHNGTGTPAIMIHPIPGRESGLDAAVTVNTHGRATAIAVSPDGEKLAIGYLNGYVAIHNATTGEVIGTFTAYSDSDTIIDSSTLLWKTTPVSVRSLAFDPSSELLATSVKAGVKVWKLSAVPSDEAFATVEPLSSIETTHTSNISAMSYVPADVKAAVNDTGDLVTGHADGTLKIWSGANSDSSEITEKLSVVHAHPAGSVSDILFLPPGQTTSSDAAIVTTLSPTDKSIRTWNLAQGYAPHSAYYGPIRASVHESKDVVRIGLASGEVRRLTIPPTTPAQ